MENQQMSFQDIKDLFIETDKRLDRRIAEIEARAAERRAEEDRRRAEERAKERAQEKAEMKQERKDSRRRMRELEDLFVGQWGKLMESLVEGDLTHLLNTRGIAVNHNQTRCKGCYQGQNYEFDIIAVNGSEVVVVEVKTSLKPEHVKQFISNLKHIKQWMTEYADKQIYGAVAWLREDSQASMMAQKQGLFSIRATGNSASIVNTVDFKPVEHAI